jgi:cbb3-type cytochrome oxidase subunit 3
MDVTLLRSIVTVMSLATFLGILYWVYHKHSAKDFEAQAHSILNENDLP